MSHVGMKIRELRNARGVKQQALAKFAGISGNSLYMIEHGGRNPSLSTLERIADALDVSPAEFFPPEDFDPKTFRVPPVEEFDLDKLENEILTRTQPKNIGELRERVREVLTARYTERELLQLRDIYTARAKELTPAEPFKGDLDAYTEAVTTVNLASRALERVATKEHA
jgi:transcriptional regulator with XRE-family HTH domain